MQPCTTVPIVRRFPSGPDYVCQSNIKIGKDACKTPTLNARHFEDLVVNKIRSNILTEGSIRDLVKVVDEEMDGVAREQRKNLRAIETELADVRRRLDTIYNLVETTAVDMADFTPRIRQHRERQERLEQPLSLSNLNPAVIQTEACPYRNQVRVCRAIKSQQRFSGIRELGGEGFSLAPGRGVSDEDSLGKVRH